MLNPTDFGADNVCFTPVCTRQQEAALKSCFSGL